MKNALTIYTIAEAAGTSPSTVSKALNNRPGISPKRRLAILKVAQDLGYAPYINTRRHGLMLPGGQDVAVLCGGVGSHLVADFLRGTGNAIKSAGLYQLFCGLFQNDPEYKRESMRMFLKKVDEDPGVTGLLAAFVEIDADILDRFEKKRLPVVLVDCPPVRQKLLRITIDHAGGSMLAARALLDLDRRHIAYVGPGPEEGWAWEERHRGIATVMAKARRRLTVERESTCDIMQGAFATQRLLERHPEIDGILYASDFQAAGGLRMLREMNVAVPDRVAVIGCDDSALCRALSPTLSSLTQPYARLGERGIHALVSLLGGRKSAARNRIIKPRLVLRGTCGYGQGSRWYLGGKRLTDPQNVGAPSSRSLPG